MLMLFSITLTCFLIILIMVSHMFITEQGLKQIVELPNLRVVFDWDFDNFIRSDDLKNLAPSELKAMVSKLSTITRIAMIDLVTGKDCDVKPPSKKEVTVEWLLNSFQKAIDKKSSKSNNLMEYTKKIVKQIGAGDPTSYGIGLNLNPFSADPYRNEASAKIKKFLDDNNIAFKTEISFGGWVKRIIISKSADTIKTLKRLAS